MEREKLQIVRDIQNGSNEAYMGLLLKNDKPQLLQHLKDSNPNWYLKNEPTLEFGNTKQIAILIVKGWKNKSILLPSFDFIPANNEYLEVINRIKLLVQ